MMDTKVRDLLNQQINKEFYSAYLYLEFSNYFEDAGLDGFANWYKIQAQEERDHAMLFYQYLQYYLYNQQYILKVSYLIQNYFQKN